MEVLKFSDSEIMAMRISKIKRINILVKMGS